MISSRTPEGENGRCPLCGHAVRISPSQFYGDAPCPVCGQLLWFIRFPSEVRLYDSLQAALLRERLDRLIQERLDENGGSSDEPEFDSLELVELLMELEADSP